jgi:AbrB family looped-hinge helix DNA binding protein
MIDFRRMESQTAKLDRSGRIMIPADIRRELDIGAGSLLTVAVKDGQIILTSRKEALRRAKAFCRSVQPDRVLSDELSEERTREAMAELED